MRKQITLKTFTRFLKKNDVYDLYLKRLVECKGQKDAIEFIILCLKRNSEDLIIGAFPWRSLPTQKKSWGLLHNEWYRLLSKKNLI